MIAYYKNDSESSMPANIVLVGNKLDLATKERQVSEEEGMRVAEAFNIPFYEVSAKKNLSVDEAFCEVAMQAMKQSQFYKAEGNSKDKIKLQKAVGEDEPKKKRKGLKFPKLKLNGKC